MANNFLPKLHLFLKWNVKLEKLDAVIKLALLVRTIQSS